MGAASVAPQGRTAPPSPYRDAAELQSSPSVSAVCRSMSPCLPGSWILGSLRGQCRSLPADSYIVFSGPRASVILAVPQAGGAARSAVPGRVGSTGRMLAGRVPRGPPRSDARCSQGAGSALLGTSLLAPGQPAPSRGAEDGLLPGTADTLIPSVLYHKEASPNFHNVADN